MKLSVDPMKRATVEDIKKHDWFKKVRLFVKKTKKNNVYNKYPKILKKCLYLECLKVFRAYHIPLFNSSLISYLTTTLEAPK